MSGSTDEDERDKAKEQLSKVAIPGSGVVTRSEVKEEESD